MLFTLLVLFSFESCGVLLLLHVDEICDMTGCKTRSYPETETGGLFHNKIKEEAIVHFSQ